MVVWIDHVFLVQFTTPHQYCTPIEKKLEEWGRAIIVISLSPIFPITPIIGSKGVIALIVVNVGMNEVHEEMTGESEKPKTENTRIFPFGCTPGCTPSYKNGRNHAFYGFVSDSKMGYPPKRQDVQPRLYEMGIFFQPSSTTFGVLTETGGEPYHIITKNKK